jgi:hypothetical protein
MQKKKPKAIVIENGKLFSQFLTKVSMNGQIPEALFVLDDGHLSSNSIDVTMTMFSMCTFFIGSTGDSLEVGIPQIATLAKHMDTDDQYKITVGEDKIAVTCKGKKGALRFRTIPKDDIATVLADDINEDSLNLDDRLHFELNGDKLEELLEYVSLTACSCIIFEIIKGKLYALSPETDTIQFRLYMCKTDEDDLRVATYAKPMSCILSILKGAPTSFYLSQDSEIVIEQEGNYWGIGCIEL